MSTLRRSVFATLVVVATLWAQAVLAGPSSCQLELLGVGWNKTEVTYLIKAGKGVNPAAVPDVQKAIKDWNDVLALVDGAPTLVPASGKSADIEFQLSAGGGQTLGYALFHTASPFSCAFKSVSIHLSGKVFGLSFSSPGRRNIARQEIGHALGLGHSTDPKDVMYPTASFDTLFGHNDTAISSCDKEGLEQIYPLPSDCNIPAFIECSCQ